MGLETALAAGSMGLSGMGAMQEAKSQTQANNLQATMAAANQKSQDSRDNANYELSKDQNTQERAYRDKLLQMMNEGYTDPTTGVTTKYVQGQGMVTSYSPRAAELIQADQNEQINRVGDQAISRRGRQANETRRMAEGNQANTYLTQMGEANPYDPKRIIADVIAKKRAGVNEGFDKTTQAALTSNLRTGTSSDNLIAQLARQRSLALSDANAGGYTEGAQAAEGLTGARDSRLGNNYNMMATRTSNMDDVPFAPQTLSNTAQESAFARNPSSAGQPVLMSPRMNDTAGSFNLNAIKANPSQLGPLANTIYGFGQFAGGDTKRTTKSQGF